MSLQPSAKLYAADGTLLGEWLGPFDEDEVLELIAGNQVSPSESSASTASFCRFAKRFTLAQVDAAAYANSDVADRQRILDDLRYAANAMAQTAQSEVAGPVERLAEAVRVDSQVLLDAGLDADPSSAAGRNSSALEHSAAIRGVEDLILETCGVSLEPTATP